MRPRTRTWDYLTAAVICASLFVSSQAHAIDPGVEVEVFGPQLFDNTGINPALNVVPFGARDGLALMTVTTTATPGWDFQIMLNSTVPFLQPAGVGMRSSVVRLYDVNELRVQINPGVMLTVKIEMAVTALAHWPFEEGTGGVIGDVSGSGRDGVVPPAEAGWVTGLSDFALQFGFPFSEVLVDCSTPDMGGGTTSDTGLDNWGAFTLEAVVKPFGAQPGDVAILSKTNLTDDGYFLGLSSNNFALCAVNTDPGNGLGATTPLAVSLWNHVACVYDGRTVKLYVNGMLEAMAPLSGATAPSDENFYIGRDAQLNGAIDDARVFDLALDPSKFLLLGGPTSFHTPTRTPFGFGSVEGGISGYESDRGSLRGPAGTISTRRQSLRGMRP